VSEESADREVWEKGIERGDGTLLFGFDTDHPEFARGVEFGQIFVEMAKRPDAYQREVHASNLVLCKRAAAALNRQISSEPVEGSMEMVHRLRLGPLPERPVPPERMPQIPPDGKAGPSSGGVFREQ
jgi:hypothetical protein